MTLPRHSYRWSVVVFARNEAARILASLKAVDEAFRGRGAHVTVLINGSSDDTAVLTTRCLSEMRADKVGYAIAHGCKSNAINQFIQRIRPQADFYLFVDATVTIERDVPALFEKAFDADAAIAAVSGLPRNGRGAIAMQRYAESEPRLFGQMFALRGTVVDRLAAIGRKLPIGLYRGDGLLSGFIVHETDGVMHADAARRLATVPQAGWNIKPLSPFRPSDIKTAFDRRVRQSRGRLESLAWNSIIWSQGFGALPAYADDMILGWLSRNRLPAAGAVEGFFRYLALRSIKKSTRPAEASLMPQQLPE